MIHGHKYNLKGKRKFKQHKMDENRLKWQQRRKRTTLFDNYEIIVFNYFLIIDYPSFGNSAY